MCVYSIVCARLIIVNSGWCPRIGSERFDMLGYQPSTRVLFCDEIQEDSLQSENMHAVHFATVLAQKVFSAKFRRRGQRMMGCQGALRTLPPLPPHVPVPVGLGVFDSQSGVWSSKLAQSVGWYRFRVVGNWRMRTRRAPGVPCVEEPGCRDAESGHPLDGGRSPPLHPPYST